MLQLLHAMSRSRVHPSDWYCRPAGHVALLHGLQTRSLVAEQGRTA